MAVIGPQYTQGPGQSVNLPNTNPSMMQAFSMGIIQGLQRQRLEEQAQKEKENNMLMALMPTLASRGQVQFGEGSNMYGPLSYRIRSNEEMDADPERIKDRLELTKLTQDVLEGNTRSRDKIRDMIYKKLEEKSWLNSSEVSSADLMKEADKQTDIYLQSRGYNPLPLDEGAPGTDGGKRIQRLDSKLKKGYVNTTVQDMLNGVSEQDAIDSLSSMNLSPELVQEIMAEVNPQVRAKKNRAQLIADNRSRLYEIWGGPGYEMVGPGKYRKRQ